MRVYIERDRSRLRIRIIYQGKRYQFSTGLTDNKPNRAYVLGIASRIELDMVSGQFDTTLTSYRPQSIGSNRIGLTCAELFSNFTSARKSDGLSQGALEKYKAVLANLERYLQDISATDLSERVAGNFVLDLKGKVSNGTARQYLYLLRSAWDWGAGQHSVKDNPWSIQIAKFKKTKVTRSKKYRPFSVDEIQAILKGFQEHRYYSHYYPFVIFQLNCGTRPGEASSLKWGDISNDFATAVIQRSYSRGVTRETTKTGVIREIDLTSRVQQLLRQIKPRNCDRNTLVFPAPKGGSINDNSFRSRAWKSVLSVAGIEYRPPYYLRHSAISHGYVGGADPLELANQAGNSVRTMQNSYLNSVNRQRVFVEF